MNIILNEKKYVENVIINPMKANETLSFSKPFKLVLILARYCYFVENMNDNDIRNKIYEFLDYIKFKYNKVKSANTIEGIIKSCKKKPLNNINSIWITENELKIIKTLNDIRLEKFLFGLLCCAKVHNSLFDKNDNWVNEDSLAIYKSCRLRSKDKDDRFMMLHKLLYMNYDGKPYISISKKNTNTNIRIEFIDNDKKVLEIDDNCLNELGYTYDNYYNNGNFTHCSSCGKLIRIKSKIGRPIEYCDECVKKMNYYQKLDYKEIKCCDCGKIIKVKGNVKNKIRCDSCQLKYNSYLKKQSYYKKLYEDGNIFEFNNCFYSSSANKYEMEREGYYLVDVKPFDKSSKQFTHMLYFKNKDERVVSPMMTFCKKIDSDLCEMFI